MFKQAIFRLPAGTTVTLTLDVPDDEVWWVTYTILGDVDDSSVLMSFTLYKEPGAGAGLIYEEHKDICAHGGWVGEPFCPPGYHRAQGKGSIVCTVENVTGDTDYNDLSEKEEFVHLTLLIFMIKKDKVKLIDRLLNKMLSKMGV